MNRNSPLSSSLLALCALAGCAHGGTPSVSSSLCNQDDAVGTQFSRLVIKVFPDQHGDYAKADICPERVFAINWSMSGLFDEPNKELLRQIRTISLRGGQPVSMVVSGNIQVEDLHDHSKISLRVTEIVAYTIDD